MHSRGGYPVPRDSPFELAPRRVAVLIVVAAVCATLAFIGGRAMGDDDSAPSVIGQRAGGTSAAVSQRLRAAPGIPALKVPAPEPTSTVATTPTTPTTPQSPPAASPPPSAPSPQPAPSAPSAPSGGGGGGSFDDSG